MNKNLTEVIFILDQSGSMYGLEKDTIGGFNNLIDKQKKEEGEALVSVVLFNHETEMVYDRVPIDQVEPMNEAQYRPGGCTALLDAVGETIKNTKFIHKHIRKEDVPAKTMIIITTDGYENSSTKYDYRDVKKLIEMQKKEGWEFIFLGANIDVTEVANRVGIDSRRAVKYKCDDVGTRTNFQALGDVVSAMRTSRNTMEFEARIEGWDEAIREYNEE